MVRWELREKFTFLVIGGMNGLCYLGFAEALHFLGLSPSVSSTVAYALCIPPGYLGQRRHTFRSTRPHGTAWIRYLVTQLIGLIVATVTTFVASAVLLLPALLAFLLSAIAAASASYVIQKSWVF
jgi:putative flippase GtrA